MKVAPQYRAGMDVNGFNVAILRDRSGFLIHGKESIEGLYEELLEVERLRESNVEEFKMLGIYPDINPAATRVIDEAVVKLNRGEQVDLENLLK